MKRQRLLNGEKMFVRRTEILSRERDILVEFIGLTRNNMGHGLGSTKKVSAIQSKEIYGP